MIAEQGGAVVFEIEAGKELASKFPTRQGGDPQEPRVVHGRRDGRRGGVLVHHDGALVPGAADGDGGGHAGADPPRVRQVHRPSRPASHSPAGSASSRCGRRSATPIPSCSTRDRATEIERAACATARSITRYLETAPPEALFVLSAVSQYVGAAIAVSAVRRGRTADRRLVPPHRGGTCAAGRRPRRPPRLDPPAARRGGDLRRGDGADEHVLLPRHRSHRSRQGRRDRVPRPDRGCRGDDADLAQRGGARARPSPAWRRSAASRSATTPSASCSSSPRRRCGPPTSSSGHGSHRSAAGWPRSRVGLSIGALVLTPIGAPWSGPVWASPTLLVLCLLTGVFSNAIGYGIDQFVLRRIPIRRFSLLLALLPGHGARRRLGRARPATVGRRPGRHLARARRSRAAGARRDRRHGRAGLNVNRPCDPLPPR